MSLSITNVVDVSILIAPKAKALQSFGKLMFVTDELPTVQGLKFPQAYKSLEAVQADWAVDSAVVASAKAFYGQGATDFMVQVAAATSTPASLNGATIVLSEVQAVDQGGFTITVDGQTQNITGLDFTAAASLGDVVTALNAELVGATAAEASGTIVITSGTSGRGSSVSFPTADIDGCAAALKLMEADGATINAALAPQTPEEALIAAADVDPSFYGIDFHKKWRDKDDAMKVAEYAQGSRRIFFHTTNDAATLDMSVDTDMASKMKMKSLQRVLTHYSSKPEEYPSSAVAGRAFLVNFEGTNTTITLNLKVMKGVTVEKMRQSEMDAMVSKNCNAVLDIAGTYVYSDSRMADGTWFDAIHGTDWLQNRVETGVFNRMFTTTTKIPYTDPGVTILIAEVEQALRQGVTNGLIAPGNNAAGEYLPLGYRIVYIPTAQVSQADKSNRVYKGITFECVGAGAMHKVVISGSFNE